MRHANQDEFIIGTTPPTDGALARAWRAAADRLRRIATARERRRTFQRLTTLDDHLLCDIGLTRDEADRLSRGED